MAKGRNSQSAQLFDEDGNELDTKVEGFLSTPHLTIRALLICDGLSSHMSLKFLCFCKERCVIVSMEFKRKEECRIVVWEESFMTTTVGTDDRG